MNLHLSPFPPNSISPSYCACKSSLSAIYFSLSFCATPTLSNNERSSESWAEWKDQRGRNKTRKKEQKRNHQISPTWLKIQNKASISWVLLDYWSQIDERRKSVITSSVSQGTYTMLRCTVRWVELGRFMSCTTGFINLIDVDLGQVVVQVSRSSAILE